MPAEIDEATRQLTRMQIELRRRSSARPIRRSRDRLQKLEKELAEIQGKARRPAGAVGKRNRRTRETRQDQSRDRTDQARDRKSQARLRPQQGRRTSIRQARVAGEAAGRGRGGADQEERRRQAVDQGRSGRGRHRRSGRAMDRDSRLAAARRRGDRSSRISRSICTSASSARTKR